MKRYTSKPAGSDCYHVSPDTILQTPDGCTGSAINRLGQFEDLCEELYAQQEELSRSLEALRREGKSKSAKFREQMGRKLMNSSFISLLQVRGLG